MLVGIYDKRLIQGEIYFALYSLIGIFNGKTINLRIVYLIVLVVIHIIISIGKVHSQSYFASKPPFGFYKVHLNYSGCECDQCCEIIDVSPTMGFHDGIGMDSLENVLVIGIASDIYKIDTNTGAFTAYFDIPGPVLDIQGLATNGGSICYIMITPQQGSTVYRINVITGSMINLGDSGYPNWGDITSYNGEYYYITRISGSPFTEALVKLDVNNPANSNIVFELPGIHYFYGLTASEYCNSFLATDQLNDQLCLINSIDGAISPLCNVPDFFYYITSTREFSLIPGCDHYLDLDCNDSSGATDGDFNSLQYTCLSTGVPITDEDIGMLYDAIISSMTIHVTGNEPDAPNEILMMTGSVAGINASGSGTGIITLTNAGGARSTDFKDALRLIVYKNTAI
ncbi:MAG: hypothetical protein ABJC12_13770, partial [Saprospiraceae bacterium]